MPLIPFTVLDSVSNGSTTARLATSKRQKAHLIAYDIAGAAQLRIDTVGTYRRRSRHTISPFEPPGLLPGASLIP
jgi:hypothetical protein